MLQVYKQKSHCIWKVGVGRFESGVIQLRLWQQGGRLLKEVPAKHYKQWSAKLEL